ncbi:conserved hypothetical protein, partial [Ixodes scapularis]
VALRVRPILPSELDKGLTCIAHKIDDKTVLLVDPQSAESAEKTRNGSSNKKVVSHKYAFDWTFDERSSQVLRLLQKGNKRRTVEPTAANKTSSRSHALLRVSIRQSSRDPSNLSSSRNRVGKLFMVDLAGSERASNTKNTGIRLKEGAHINRSLLALGNVINALGMRNPKYVNFRDSKLTRMLKEALSGNCKTVMVAHISPASAHYDESRNTLVYAERARNITNK